MTESNLDNPQILRRSLYPDPLQRGRAGDARGSDWSHQDGLLSSRDQVLSINQPPAPPRHLPKGPGGYRESSPGQDQGEDDGL